MSIYTESASRPGQKAGSGSDRELWLRKFGGMVITSYDEGVEDYNDLRYTKQLDSGKSDLFPILGRKRDAAEHEVGELIVGGKVQNDEREITVDQMLIDSIFLGEQDTLLSHFDVMGPYTHQLGMSIGQAVATRTARMQVLASREYWSGSSTTGVPQGQVAPSYYYNASLKTDPSKIEDFAFAGKQYLLENDISGETPWMMLPWAQYLLFARYFGVTDFKEAAGSGSKTTGKVGQVAGMNIKGTNFVPKTNVTTGNVKYRGDFSTTVGHISNKMAVGCLEVRGLRVVRKDQPERLGTLMIASKMEGMGPLRPECSFEGATAARA
jgi:hypothetical protein